MTGRNVIWWKHSGYGLTLNYIQKLLQAHQPLTLRIAALLDKPSRRQMPIHAHYIGFAIPDTYLSDMGGLCGTISQPAGYLRDRESLAGGTQSDTARRTISVRTQSGRSGCMIKDVSSGPHN